MKTLLTASQMKYCDQTTIREYGIASLVLMERAALGCVEELLSAGENSFLKQRKQVRFLIACGSGNNGGDGFAIARMLVERGYDTTILFCGKETSLTEETRTQRKICLKMGIREIRELKRGELYDCIVDAIFGVGLSREITGNYRELIEALNRMDAFRFAVDIPSGVSADTGEVLGCAFLADLTVTFAWAKRGHFLFPGSGFCGKTVVRKIGIFPWLLQEDAFPGNGVLLVPEKEDLQELLPKRRTDGNKGTFGKVLVLAGCDSMYGASFLAGKAAAHAGCGMVRVVTEERNRSSLCTAFPEALFTFWRSSEPLPKEALANAADWADTFVLGPGLGTSSKARELLRFYLEKANGPVVLDADALNLLSADPDLWELVPKNSILTPHIGEMARLCGSSSARIKTDPVETARKAAKEHSVIVVLKDARTVITDGEAAYLNTAGNNGMAAAGSGDVLAGIVGGLLAQKTEPLMAAVTGVLMHAAAGDFAAEEKGCSAMTASDILSRIFLTNRY